MITFIQKGVLMVIQKVKEILCLLIAVGIEDQPEKIDIFNKNKVQLPLIFAFYGLKYRSM